MEIQTSNSPWYFVTAVRPSLAGNQRLLIVKALEKAKQNPLPIQEGGYGKPLGNRTTTKLSGFMKLKLRGAGLRIVYKLIRTETEMLIVVIGARADEEVYATAQKRIDRHHI